MYRILVSFEHEQYRRLRDEARRKGISISALIRQLVDEHFSTATTSTIDPLDAIKGIGSGSGEPVGRGHNSYLYRNAD